MPSYLDNYAKRLLRRREEIQAKKAEKESPLQEQITIWHASLPPSEKGIPVSMAFFVKRFGRPPSEIGPVLSEQLNWKRIRNWQSQGSYRRLWIADNTNNK